MAFKHYIPAFFVVALLVASNVAQARKYTCFKMLMYGGWFRL